MITVLPFNYQPNDPVENAFTSASISCPLMPTFNGSALDRNCARDNGQDDFAMAVMVQTRGANAKDARAREPRRRLRSYRRTA